MTEKATNLNTHASGRIFDEKAGLRCLLRGDKAECLSHKRAAAIHDSSPKANAQTKKAQINTLRVDKSQKLLLTHTLNRILHSFKKRAAAIHDSSPKANAQTKKAQINTLRVDKSQKLLLTHTLNRILHSFKLCYSRLFAIK